MPLPNKPLDAKVCGPVPLCSCGVCSVCKNRERQKRFRERQKEKADLGLVEEDIRKILPFPGGDDE